jgi:hypothetical protein
MYIPTFAVVAEASASKPKNMNMYILERKVNDVVFVQENVNKCVFNETRERPAGVTAIAEPVVSGGRSDSIRLYVLILWRRHPTFFPSKIS